MTQETRYQSVCRELVEQPKVWLVTGAAGFIGSNLVETLLKLNQRVVGLDNFSTGYQKNLDEVKNSVSPQQWSGFRFIEGDIRDLAACRFAVQGVDYVLHQAALGSVPRSVDDPLTSDAVNVGGFLNMLVASRDAKVKSFTYAASSSTYGDHPGLPKVEDKIGNPLSPYAVTKLVNELYAGVFAKNYQFKSIGLRYFNVFGRRQDPNGAYAAVIPTWTSAMMSGETVYVNGDGETSRDFCFIDNTVQMNILAATAQDEMKDQVYNVAVGDRTTLNELYDAIRTALVNEGAEVLQLRPEYRDFRAGDVRHSQADITKAKNALGYQPQFTVSSGIMDAMGWYYQSLKKH